MRRRKTITREDLLHRYANAIGTTFGHAHDLAADLSNDQLRDRVEFIESETALPGQRQSFARSQPTTRLHGQTR